MLSSAPTTIAALLSIISLTTAIPTPVALAPRCGTTVYPTILQQLTETTPWTTQPNTLTTTSDFHVSQTVTNGVTHSRILQIVAFQNIPSTAYACQLNVQFPTSWPISSYGNPVLNVTTLYKDNPSAIAYPNDWSWAKFFPASGAPVSKGLFGTVTLAQGQNTVINSESCASSLAFVFEIASWVGTTSSVEFTEYINMLNGQGLAGVYLTHSC